MGAYLRKYKSVFSGILPSALRTVTQTTTINTSGLYQLANAAVGDTLKVAKNGNFKEDYISGIKEEIEKLSSVYRDLFRQCSVYLEKRSGVSVEANILKGIGTASKAVGKFFTGGSQQD